MNAPIPKERVWVGNSKFKSILAITHITAVILFPVATLILAWMTPHTANQFSVLYLMPLAMAATMASNGIFNDVIDWQSDQVSKPWRAIPAGHIRPGTAVILAGALLCLGLFLAYKVSLIVMLLLLGGTGVYFLYNVKLKHTLFSWLAYVIAYPSLPVWVLVGLDRYTPQILWIYLAAAPLVIGMHLTHQLRDYDQDLAEGVKGFPQYLGKKASALATFILLSMAPISLIFLLVRTRNPWIYLSVILVVTFYYLLLFSHYWFPLENIKTEFYRVLFRKITVSSMLFLFTWYGLFLHTLYK